MHAQRPEEVVLERLRGWQVGQLLDDQPQQDVVGVVVVPALARGKVGRVLEGDGQQLGWLPGLEGSTT